MVNSISPYLADKSLSAKATSNLPTTLPANSGTIRSEITTNSSDSVSVSLLSQQLSRAAAAAEARSNSLSRPELAARAKEIVLELHGDSYTANKAAHDRESQRISNPEHRARAEQATQFINSDRANLPHKTANPFYGLSRAQLATITYDESGSFTVNERVAASDEAFRQEFEWREKVADQAMAEYAATGKLTNFFKEVLRHFNELPEMEQMQAPAGYAADLESKIKADFNYNPNQTNDKKDAPKDLISMLLQRAQDLDQEE